MSVRSAQRLRQAETLDAVGGPGGSVAFIALARVGQFASYQGLLMPGSLVSGGSRRRGLGRAEWWMAFKA